MEWFLSERSWTMEVLWGCKPRFGPPRARRSIPARGKTFSSGTAEVIRKYGNLSPDLQEGGRLVEIKRFMFYRF
jgi:hypothetical protein